MGADRSVPPAERLEFNLRRARVLIPVAFAVFVFGFTSQPWALAI